ncbi:MAG TPA: hypothetical protein VFE15_10245, partial [Marmoricola sp.]|nr:hypothetical protein [Marmoricola sp.]
TLWFCGWITGQGSGWVGGLSVPGHAHTPLAVTTDLGLVLRDVAERLGVASSAMVGVDDPLALCRHLGVVALLLLVGWALLRHRLVDSETALAMVGAVLLVAALLSPAVHPWYALWAIPILACVRLSVPAAAALVGGIGILGITALEDGALPFVWLKVASTLAVLLGPPLIWYAASRLGARADTAKPEAVGAD